MKKEQPDIDEHKLIYHPERVSEWLEKGDCYPIYVEIGPTNRCNHRCIFCALDWLGEDNANINREVMIKSLEDMTSYGVKSVMFSGEGEPLLHKDICEFVQHAKKSGLDVSITTNGVLFDKKKAEACLSYLSWIRFSVDAGSPENYAKIHKTNYKDFDKVIENIQESIKIRNKSGLETTIEVQFLLMPQNVNEVIKLAEIAKEIGADNLQVKPYSQHPSSINRFVIDYESYAYLEPELEKISSDKFKVLFRKKTMQRLKEGVNYDYCYGLPFFALIDAKGNIIPCNLFYNNPEFTYGNLNEKSFKEIWQSENRKQVIEKIKKRGIDVCRHGCRLNPINKYLHRLKNPDLHDNFV